MFILPRVGYLRINPPVMWRAYRATSFMAAALAAIIFTCAPSIAHAQSNGSLADRFQQQELQITPAQVYVSCFLYLNKGRVEGDPILGGNKDQHIVPFGPVTCPSLQLKIMGLVVSQDVKNPWLLMCPKKDELMGDQFVENVATAYLTYFEKNAAVLKAAGVMGISALALSMVEQYPCGKKAR